MSFVRYESEFASQQFALELTDVRLPADEEPPLDGRNTSVPASNRVQRAALFGFDFAFAFSALWLTSQVTRQGTAVVFALVTAANLDGYRWPVLTTRLSDDLPSLIARTGSGALALGLGWTIVTRQPPTELMMLTVISVVGVILARLITSLLLRRHWTPLVAIVGEGAVPLLSELLIDRDRTFGRSSALVGDATGKPPDVIVVDMVDEETRGWVAKAWLSGATVYRTQESNVGIRSAVTVEVVGGHPLWRLAPRPMLRSTFFIKRVFDVVIATIVLAITAPLQVLGLAAVARDGRPLLYSHHRLGLGGVPFLMLKIRTLPAAYRDKKLNGDPDEFVAGGRLMRRLSIDELPQTLNVLRGDLTVVGPRPERVLTAAALSAQVEGYDLRTRLPMGLTGLAQVQGLRGDTSMTDRIRYDNCYIDTWSLWQDLVIMAKTPLSILRLPAGAAPKAGET